MSFRRQVGWALTRGLGAGLAGVMLAFATVILEVHGLRPLQDVAAALSMALIAGGALLALGGGVVRPLQRWAFLHGMPSGRLRQHVLDQPALRWWDRIDADGRACDD